jgi:hypothetical protein
MTLILSGTDGLSDVDGSAATPAIRGTDANTGIFFGADIIGFAEGGAEVARFNADAQFVAAAGTASLPVITTTGDVNTGIFFPAADQVAITTGGTQRAVVDASGNLGVGTTSPSRFVDFEKNQNASTILRVGNTTSGTGAYSALQLSSSTASYLYNFSNAYTTNGIFVAGATVLDASGSGGLSFNAASVGIIFNTGSTERARIDSGGNLLVGTTGQIGTEKIGVEQTSTTGQAVYCYAANASYAGNVIVVNTARAANTAFTSIATYSAGVNQFYVGGTGLIYSVQLAGGATTLSVNASGQIIRTPSDASLKTNIQPITYGLDTVMKLKPIKHEWVEEINMGAPSIGFIAQDMELEVPEVVSGEEYKSIDYPKLTAVLTKAIQEQQALITTLTDRITALEAK